MKCLFCQKELAIFKRLSGSEFCSDAHRKQYQQEYNQLALSRLLHSQPASQKTVARPDTSLVPGGGHPGAQTHAPPSPRPTMAPPVSGPPAQTTNGNSHKSTTPPPAALKPVPHATVLPAATTAPPVRDSPASRVTPLPAAGTALPSPAEKTPVAMATAAEPELAAPAPIAGLLDNKPPAKQAETAAWAAISVENLDTGFQPAPPSAFMEAMAADLKCAGQVAFESGLVMPKSGTISIASRPEARDFSRPMPKMETTYTILIPALQSASQPLRISVEARAPEPACLWTSAAMAFRQTSQVATGQMLECDLPATDIDIPESRQADAPPKAQENTANSNAIEPHRPEAPTESLSQVVANSNAGKPSEADVAAVGEKAPFSPAAKPLTIIPRAAEAAKAKLAQMFQATLPSTSKVEISRHDAQPLRPVMVVQRATSAKAAADAKATATVKFEPTKRAPAPAVSAVSQGVKPIPAAQSSSIAADKPPHPKPPSSNKTNGENGKPTVQKSGGAAPQHPGKPASTMKPVAGNPPQHLANAAGSAQYAGLFIQARPAETPPAEAKVSAALPKPAGSPFANRELNLPELHLPELHLGGSRMPNRTVFFAAGAVAAVLLIVLVGFSVKGSSSPRTSAPPVTANAAGIGAGPDWIENFSPDPLHPRTISLLRSSGDYKDYRIEMEARIESKALGWVFRAKNSRNFQVGKIEVRRTGSVVNPYLVHFAVINGAAESARQVPIPITVSPSTVYRVRFEVTGNRFTAYVQDRKVDEWTDGRIASGGAGLYSDSGERAIFESAFDVTPAGKTN